MKKMILLSEVAYLAKHLSRNSERVVVPYNVQSISEELYSSIKGSYPSVDGSLSPPEEIDNEEMKKQISSSAQMEIKDMLGEWEEPEVRGDVYKVSGLVPKFVARYFSNRTITMAVKLMSYTGRRNNDIDPPHPKSARLY
jgi:hypothetical protein